MPSERERLLELAEEVERRALAIEGDSDNPLRVAAANRLFDKADRLRALASQEVK